MQTSKAWLLLLFNIFAAVALTSTAHAQDVVPVAQTASNALLERGVLGIFVVLEGIVIFLLFKDLKQQHEKTLEWAVKATEVLATAMAGAQKSEATQLKVLEQLVKNETTLSRAEHLLSRVAEKLGSGGSRAGD